MPLSAGVLAKIGTANAAAVEHAFDSLGSHWSNGQFLTASNRYRRNCIDRIKTDVAPNHRVHQSHLSEYIASSSFLHCMDGWSLLGRAIACHIHGDSETSTHLAYYAELRGAMSLLGCEGLGVFDKKHFVMDKPGRVSYVGGAPGTHEYTWEALDQWASSASATALVFRIVSPGGRDLQEWLDAFSLTPGANSILVKDWISTWGLDLARLRMDRNARNLSSYRPTAFHSSDAIPIADSVSRLVEFWRLAEPNGTSAFRRLDDFLLRDVLQRKFRGASGPTAKQARRVFAKHIDAMFHQLSPLAGGFPSAEFLIQSADIDRPQLLREAAGKLKPGAPGHDLQVIARGTLMLRLASGAVRKLLSARSQQERESLRFWLTPLAERMGMCAKGDFPASCLDFWGDVDAAIDTVEDWLMKTPAHNQEPIDFMRSRSREARVLASAEFAGMWAMGL